MNQAFLGPVLAQVALTLVVALLLFARRIPAMQKASPTAKQLQDKSLLPQLPAGARFSGENYNHQFEAPVLLYALCLVGAVSGAGGALAVQLAWAYVVLRVVHAIIHNTYNKVMHRFGVFVLSILVLIAMCAVMALDYFG